MCTMALITLGLGGPIVQSPAKRRVLGCVIPRPSSLWPLGEFAQPSTHHSAVYCTLHFLLLSYYCPLSFLVWQQENYHPVRCSFVLEADPFERGDQLQIASKERHVLVQGD